MKNFISVLSAMALCGVLFTACSGVAAEYDSMDAMLKEDVLALAETNVSAEDSSIYSFISGLEGASEFYLDVESTDGNMSMVLGIEDEKVYTSVNSIGEDLEIDLLIRDGRMYMLDSESKIAMSMVADENIMDDYDIESMLGSINVDENIKNAEDVKSCTIKIAGEKYTLEVTETGGGFLFDANGRFSAIISVDGGQATALKINDFSTDAPSELFEISEDYELLDLEDLLEGQE